MVRCANSAQSSDEPSTIVESTFPDWEPFKPTAEETSSLKKLYHEYMRMQEGEDPDKFKKPRRPRPEYNAIYWNQMAEIWKEYINRSWAELFERCRCRKCGEPPGPAPRSPWNNREIQHAKRRRPNNGRPGWVMIQELKQDSVLRHTTFRVVGVPEVPGNPSGWMDMEELLYDRQSLFEMAECLYKADAKGTRCSRHSSAKSIGPWFYEPRVRWGWGETYAL